MSTSRRSTTALIAGMLGATVAASALVAQQTVPFRNDIPVAPSGIVVPPLPPGPFVYDTAEGMRIRVVVVARGLANPWSVAWLPDGTALITERAGRLRALRNGVLDPQPVAGVPAVRASGLAGLYDVTLHPQVARNGFVYLSYMKPKGEKESVVALARGRWDGKALVEVKDIFVAEATTGGPARLAFGRDGMIYMTTGGVNNGAQDPNSHEGKVLRLKDDGTVPPDNPFVGRAAYKPEVYTLGHRSSLGLAMHPGTGEMWQNENGPNGGDEINVLKRGGNYGWPLVSLGRMYPGPRQAEVPWKEGMEQPFVSWIPSIAVSGMAFYTGNKLPKWKGDVFVGALRVGEVPGTGHFERILFNQKMEELRRESLLTDLKHRIRDIRQGPDELLYLLTDHPTDAALLRVEPAS
jgi:glucose/arabinose dehydrogenase